MPPAAPRRNPWNARGLLPYSRPVALATLDQRTREARLIRETRAELVRHLGGNPSATQAAMIEQAVQLRLRLAVMDRKFAEGGEQTLHDSRTYLAWSGSYTRLLARLGLEAAPAPVVSLADRLAASPAAAAWSRPPGPVQPPGPVTAPPAAEPPLAPAVAALVPAL